MLQSIRFLSKKNKKIASISLALTAGISVVFLVFYIFKFSLPLKHDGASLYLLDFNFYFGTRIFIGSIYTLLTDHISENTIFILNLLVYLLCFFLISKMIFSIVNTSAELKNNTLFSTVPFLLLCPYSILQFAGWIGTYDIWLCLMMLLSCALVNKRFGQWLTPAISVCAVFTHIAYAVSFFPVVVCVQFFYFVSNNNKRKVRNVFSIAVNVLITLAASVYCVFFAKSTIKMTETELYEYMANRTGGSVGNWQYIQLYYFNTKNNFEMLKALKSTDIGYMLKVILLFLPFFLVFSALWVGCIKQSKNWKDKIKYSLFIVVLIITSSVVFFIDEERRWQSAAIISQVVLLICCLQNKDKPFLNFIQLINTRRVVRLILGITAFGLCLLLLVPPHNYY